MRAPPAAPFGVRASAIASGQDPGPATLLRRVRRLRRVPDVLWVSLARLAVQALPPRRRVASGWPFGLFSGPDKVGTTTGVQQRARSCLLRSAVEGRQESRSDVRAGAERGCARLGNRGASAVRGSGKACILGVLRNANFSYVKLGQLPFFFGRVQCNRELVGKTRVPKSAVRLLFRLRLLVVAVLEHVV